MQRKKGAEEYHIKRRSTLNQLDAKHYSGAAGVEVDHPKVIRVRSRFIRYKRERGELKERESEREREMPAHPHIATHYHARAFCELQACNTHATRTCAVLPASNLIYISIIIRSGPSLLMLGQPYN